MKRIPLRASDGSVCAWAFVDDADFEWLNQWRWYLKNGYAGRSAGPRGGRRTVYVHRLILGLEPGDPRQGEHENRNPLDCQRSNLRIATRADADNKQNLSLQVNNTSGYRGVVWSKRVRKWLARTQIDGRSNHLGCFDTPEEADVVVKAFRAAHMPFSEDALRVAA